MPVRSTVPRVPVVDQRKKEIEQTCDCIHTDFNHIRKFLDQTPSSLHRDAKRAIWLAVRAGRRMRELEHIQELQPVMSQRSLGREWLRPLYEGERFLKRKIRYLKKHCRHVSMQWSW